LAEGSETISTGQFEWLEWRDVTERRQLDEELQEIQYRLKGNRLWHLLKNAIKLLPKAGWSYFRLPETRTTMSLS